MTPRLWALIGTLAAVSLAVLFVTDGNVGAMLAPLLALGLLALVWFVPLRWSALGLLFLGATLEAPYEAFATYRFRTPLFVVGSALLGNLNLVTHVSALKFSGFDLLMLYLFLVHAVRRARRSHVDGNGFVPLPRPLVHTALLSATCILIFWAWGLSRGGDFANSLWQIQKPFYIPLLAMLLHACLRGPQDLPALGSTLIAAAVYRALLATYIHYTVTAANGEPLPHATTHGDSMLFAGALTLLIVGRNERLRVARHWSALLLGAILVLGMVSNGRRLVWVSLAGSLLIVALISPWTPFKRRVARALLVLSPAIALYLTAGWSSTSGLFAPAQIVRSMVDSKSDSSTAWRDGENANLVRNIGDHPVLGVGFGHQYVEYGKLDDVSVFYPQYRYIPHNSVLAMFAFAGALGAAGIWSVLAATVFFAARAYHRSARPVERAGAMMCIVIVFLYLNQVYGDIGVNQWITLLMVAPAITLAGKLAISTGAWAWPARRRPRTSASSASPLHAPTLT